MTYALTYKFNSLEELKAHLDSGGVVAPIVKEAKQEKKVKPGPLVKQEAEKIEGNTSKIPFKKKETQPVAEETTGGDEISYEQVKDLTFAIIKKLGNVEGREKVVNLYKQFDHKENPRLKAAKGPELKEEDYAAFIEGAKAILGIDQGIAAQEDDLV
jgi:hypothetical protein